MIFDEFLCVVLKVYKPYKRLAQWLSWLERRPVTAKVVGSSPIWVVHMEHSCGGNFISHGILAQLGEHLPYKQRVIGSSPIGPIFGRFPEWPKGTDCKSAANCFGGSNPPPSIENRLPEQSIFMPAWRNWQTHRT